MDALKPEVSPGRPKRALALISLALMMLAVTGGAYVWRGASSTDRAPAPNKAGGAELVDMASISEQEAWVIVHSVGAPESALFHTGDGGASWRRQLSIEGLGAVRFAASRTGVLVNWRLGADPRTSTPRVFSTDDGGTHWRSVTLPQLGPGSRGLPFFLDPDHGWLLATRPTSPGDQPPEVNLWRTVNGGRRWEPLLNVDEAHPLSHGVSGGDQLVALSFQDRETGWIVTEGAAADSAVYASHDGGHQWTRVALPAGLPGAAPEDWVYVGIPAVRPDGRGVVPLVDRDASRIWLYQTPDGGLSWVNPEPAPGTGVVNVAFVDGSVGWASGSSAVWVSGDSGRTWLAATGLTGRFLFGVLAPASSSVAWVQGNELRAGSTTATAWSLFRTTDGGLHWTRVPAPSLF
jgi:prepilin-type processing-associated H-X9-DG protein